VCPIHAMQFQVVRLCGRLALLPMMVVLKVGVLGAVHYRGTLTLLQATNHGYPTKPHFFIAFRSPERVPGYDLAFGRTAAYKCYLLPAAFL
jgi:hypothetical protein